MPQKELASTKGLVIANTVLVVNGTSVGIGTATPSYALHISATDGLVVPVGNTAQRPSSVSGLIRYNTDQADFEMIRGGTWETFNSVASNTSAAISAVVASSSNTQVLYNNSSSVGGSAGFTFNKTSNNLTVSNSVLTTTINAASHTVGSSFVANTTGVFHTGTINAASHTIGSSFVANSTGTYHSGLANASQFVIPNAMVANSTGIYHTIVAAGILTVNSTSQSFLANSTGAYHIGTMNAASFTVGSSTIANSSGVYTGVVNATSVIVSGSLTANSSRIVIGTVGVSANGSLGSSGNVLKTNGTSTYWGTDSTGVNQVSTGNGLTGGPITDTGTVAVLANNGIVANSTGVFVNAGTGVVVNATGVHVNSTYIGTQTANNSNYLGGVLAGNYARLDSNNSFNGVGNFTYTTAGQSAIIATANAYGIVALSTNNSWGGVLGYSANQSYYGILGYQNLYAFYGNGNIFTTGDLQVTGNMTGYFSDRRLKEKIRPIKNALDMLEEITGVFYEHNALAKQYGFTDEGTQVGVIAQDVEKVLPQAIAPAPFDVKANTGYQYMTVMMDKLIPVIIESIKELRDKIDDITSSK